MIKSRFVMRIMVACARSPWLMTTGEEACGCLRFRRSQVMCLKIAGHEQICRAAR